MDGAADSNQHVPPFVQEAMLTEALRKPPVRDLVPPVVCVGFGVLPLGERDDALILALRSDVPETSLPALQAILKRPLHLIRFERDQIDRHMAELNQRVGGINMPTFDGPDFLDDPDERSRLLHPKVEEGVTPFCEISTDEVVLLDYLYLSEMQNLDAAEDTTHYVGTMSVPFRVRDGAATMYLNEAKAPETAMVVRRQFSLRGREHAVGLAGRVIKRDELPYVSHPTEIQVRGVTKTGLVIHNYDRDEFIPTGGASSAFGCTYHFLEAGQRQYRRLRFEVRGAWCVRKDELRFADKPEWGDDTDLTQWFHFHDAPRPVHPPRSGPLPMLPPLDDWNAVISDADSGDEEPKDEHATD